MTSSIWNWLLFTLIQRDKVKWVCVTLNEGYLRPANRGSNNLQIFNQSITDQPSMKRRIFLVCLFYCFFLDCRSTNLLRLFSGNLPAMFLLVIIGAYSNLFWCHLKRLSDFSYSPAPTCRSRAIPPTLVGYVCIWCQLIAFDAKRCIGSQCS